MLLLLSNKFTLIKSTKICYHLEIRKKVLTTWIITIVFHIGLTNKKSETAKFKIKTILFVEQDGIIINMRFEFSAQWSVGILVI